MVPLNIFISISLLSKATQIMDFHEAVLVCAFLDRIMAESWI